ncbi:DNA topoisomerase 1 [Piscirickettsia salmonis]|uniref:DNA topoisomerase 1 n=1 Tax=Piscirickettsia salmonis TaxID=1238 RepID=A0A1L6TFN5_PISSA|nr:type I DNA topoisomerase [Piscirickettsia salmonis]AKP72278.1 DNA topoisomerase I [Piscirickettsia salmonis LF-89 = ATCC VR-1361]ALB24279.1 DNA topoisomerase I [Piscirickettsia salmonis]ALY04078.1 DNA topoisomerase I [Piscirickettsia salmonis]AMA43632.1 DNA topoisomerase I [Piscirickettsia salmonis]AOS36101.1 DNA topoisomerase I [Piscirickettsia salmonis]
MGNKLVIVESPAKGKTINKYLGKDFQVMASYGHVRDLLPKEGAVQPEHDFSMTYQLTERGEKSINDIIKALRQSTDLYLASDPDREGEAIAWHLLEELKARGELEGKTVHRVVFYEITERAVQDAINNPREVAMDLVDAQQARRALDYLVGFNLSPLLWKKIRRGLSAGRVQSPALRMIVEREQEIQAFKSKEYWTIASDLIHDQQAFSAKLTLHNNEKVKQFTFTNEKAATKAQQTLIKKANNILKVVNVEKKQRKRNPAAPFTTSTLQQEAVRKLGFSAQRTMRTAQQLYEGIATGDGTVGLITYMRTDSVYLADEAITELRELIVDRYGQEALPKSPRAFKSKAKNAQEAHEAVRPTSCMRLPKELKPHLSTDQFKLYELIWKRTVACQMQHALIDTVAVDLACGDEKHLFRANGSQIAKPGFLSVYEESKDDDKEDDDKRWLPIMKTGESIQLLEIKADQHFTEPRPRYTEATLIKTLEEHGIGRPSTYTAILSTLQQREYIELDKKRFQPTDVGNVVNKFLTKYFEKYVDYEFTAHLEDDLDAISRGEKQWKPLMHDFWSPFQDQVKTIDETVQRKDVTQEELDEDCPKCSAKLSERLGRRGKFIGCTNYPECDYTRSLDGEEQAAPEKVDDRQCPKCDSDLYIRQGRYGKFIGCSNYPKCKFIEPLEKPTETGVECPECKQSHLVQRRSRYGKIFYSCNRYPDCKYAVWNEPLKESCPTCQWPILTIKTTKRWGTEKVCPQKECGFKAPYELPESEQTEQQSTEEKK